MVEDVFGFKFPVPSEYSYDLLEEIIKHKFRTGPASLEVKTGNYELFKTKNNKEVIEADRRILPGTCITMAIIVITPRGIEDCPTPLCSSDRTLPAPSGVRLW